MSLKLNSPIVFLVFYSSGTKKPKQTNKQKDIVFGTTFTIYYQSHTSYTSPKI